MIRLAAVRIWSNAKPLLFGTIGIVALLNGSVALMAFVKDVLLASYFGTSVQADGLTLAYFLPDTIGNTLIASALGVSCVPVFSQAIASGDRERLRRQVHTSMIVFSAFAIAVSSIIFAFSGNITAWMAGPETSELGHLTEPLLRIILPMVIFFPALAIGVALLQTSGSFAAPAGVPLLPHVIIVIVLLSCMLAEINKTTAVYTVAWSITLGAAAMAIAVWFAILRLKPLQRVPVETAHYNLNSVQKQSRRQDHRQLWGAFVPYLVIILIGQIVYFMERKWASGMETGTVAGLNYAFRLSQLPIWVFVAAVYSVVLPSMSQDAALHRKARLISTLTKAFKSILIVTLPTTLFLYDLRVPIVSLLFQRGAFNEHSVVMTAGIVGGYALSIAGLSISAVCLRYFLAAGKMTLPTLITLTSTGINIAADYILKDSFGAAGLGYGAAIGATISAALFLLCVCRELNISLSERFRGLFPIMAANLILLLFLLLAAEVWPFKPEQVQASLVFIKAVCTALAGVLVYFAALWFLNRNSNRR